MAETTVKSAGSVCCTDTLVAVSGPRLVTSIVYVMLLDTCTGLGVAVMLKPKSTPGHCPPPSVQSVGVKNRDQHWIVPVSPVAVSIASNCHVPLTLVPLRPIKFANGCTGLNEPTKGATPPAIG